MFSNLWRQTSLEGMCHIGEGKKVCSYVELSLPLQYLPTASFNSLSSERTFDLIAALLFEESACLFTAPRSRAMAQAVSSIFFSVPDLASTVQSICITPSCQKSFNRRVWVNKSRLPQESFAVSVYSKGFKSVTSFNFTGASQEPTKYTWESFNSWNQLCIFKALCPSTTRHFLLFFMMLHLFATIFLR